MDRRWKKRLEDFLSKVRQLFNRYWHNDPEGDAFRFLDVMFVLGAVRYKPISKWQRIFWNTYYMVTLCSYLIVLLNVFDETRGKFDVVKATWHASVGLIVTLCYVKDFILNQRYESIQATRNFINGKPMRSGDKVYDSALRKKLFQRLQLTGLVCFVILLMDQIIFALPNSGISELYGTPKVLLHLGQTSADGIHSLFILTLPLIWFNKYCVVTGTICSLLYAFETEYQILVRGFGKILDQVYSDVEDTLPDDLKAAPDWKHYQRDQQFWKSLKKRVNEQVKLHVQLVENMRLLQPVVRDLFGILYYNAMVIFSPFIYVVLFNDVSIATIFIVFGIVMNLIECYAWCSFIESQQDVNETLELKIMSLITKIPHSELYHKKYVEIRTTLFIIKTFIRNDQRFSCGGVFTINGEAFTNLLNIGYTVLTFLLDVGKKDWRESLRNKF